MPSLLPSARTVHWGYFDALLKPVAEIGEGEVLHLRSVSGTPADPVPSDWIPREILQIYAEIRERGPGGHITTGPVFIHDTHPGSTLQIEILSIQLGSMYGYNTVVPGRGMFPDAVHTSSKQIIPIDQQTGLAQLPVGVSLPTRPFFGILGVAPPPSLGRIDSTAPGCHGGNIDNKELVAGTTLFLPVWVEGALFSAGDGHAAQGDGEVDITAIETCLEGDFRFKVRNDISLTLPIAVTPTHIVTMGFHEDLDRAAEIAVRSLLDLLERYCHLQPLDSYRLASIAVDLRVTQVVNGLKGIHTMLARSLWDQLGSVIDFAATA